MGEHARAGIALVSGALGSGSARGPRYAFFYRGRWRVNPWITHPPLCVCAQCAAAPSPSPRRVRIDRVSPYDTETGSIGYAALLREQEEARLRRAVDQARAGGLALAAAVSLGTVMDAYRHYLATEGKRLDRDTYRIDAIEHYFGTAREAEGITKRDVMAFRRWLSEERGAGPATVARYLATLVAALNGAVKEGIIVGHKIGGMRRPAARLAGKPCTFTAAQVQTLMGPAMDRFEREQNERRARGLLASSVPLRGLCLVAYRTLLRPENNFWLRWDEINFAGDGGAGSIRIGRHKNAGRGVRLEFPLAQGLAEYLARLRADARGPYVHPNPGTGRPFTNIRRAWGQLLEIANQILPPEEQTGERARFYSWRATGASELAAAGADPVLIARMMGDTSLRTVLDHYFDSSQAHMSQALARWEGRVAS
jgi:integrase